MTEISMTDALSSPAEAVGWIRELAQQRLSELDIRELLRRQPTAHNRPVDLAKALPWQQISQVGGRKSYFEWLVDLTRLSSSSYFGGLVLAAAAVKAIHPDCRLQLGEVVCHTRQAQVRRSLLQHNSLDQVMEVYHCELPTFVLQIDGYEFDPDLFLRGEEANHLDVQYYPVWEGVTAVVLAAHAQLEASSIGREIDQATELAMVDLADELCPGMILSVMTRALLLDQTQPHDRPRAVSLIEERVLPRCKTAYGLYLLSQMRAETDASAKYLDEINQLYGPGMLAFFRGDPRTSAQAIT